MNNILLDIFSMGGKIGVNIFCLIMGYFGIKSKGVNIKKLLVIEMQVLFYSYTGFMLAVIFNNESISVKKIVYTIMPTLTEHYWFFTAYVIMVCFSGYLNKLLLQTEQKSYLKLLLLCYTIWGIIPFFMAKESSGMFWNQFIWFFVMYITGAYLKIYPYHNYNKVIYIIVVLISVVCMMSTFLVLEVLSQRYQFIQGHTTYFRWSNSPFSILISISLFRIACISQKTDCWWINRIASYVFGIYLFHENVFIQEILWGRIFNASDVVNPIILFMHYAISVFSVFVAGMFVEVVRRKIEGLWVHHMDSISFKLNKFLDVSIQRIIDR